MRKHDIKDSLKGDSWVIDDKFEIVKENGCCYYYELCDKPNRDLPQWLFKLRDELMKQKRIKEIIEAFDDEIYYLLHHNKNLTKKQYETVLNIESLFSDLTCLTGVYKNERY